MTRFGTCKRSSSEQKVHKGDSVLPSIQVFPSIQGGFHSTRIYLSKERSWSKGVLWLSPDFSASTSHIQCLRPLQVHQLPGDSSRQRPWVYFCRIGGSEACRDGHQELWLFNMCRTGPSAIFPRLHWLHVLKTHTDCHSDGLSCVTGWWFGTFEWMIFPIILGMSSSQLTFTPSFFRGVG